MFEDESNPKSSYAAAKKFKAEGHLVNKQSIHGWIKCKDDIMNINNTKRRVLGKERKCLLGSDVEDQLAGIIAKERQEGNRVCGSQVKNWAMELAVTNDIVNFNASDGWLSNFLSRIGFFLSSNESHLIEIQRTNQKSVKLHDLSTTSYKWRNKLGSHNSDG